MRVRALLAVLVHLLAAAGPSYAAAEADVRDSIKIRGDLLTTSVAGAPLQSVLEAIARESGVKILIFAPTEERITVEFREVPLDVALRRLVREKNYVFIYSRSRPRADAGARSQRLKEVHVYPGPAEAIARPEPTAAPDASRATSPAVEGLARVLLEAEPRVLRKRAAGALGTMRDQLATDALRRALAQDDDASVREAAARSLGKTWDEDAVAPLASAVVDDPDAFVREAAATGLGETWSEAAVEPLARALATDPRAAVREVAAVGLGRTWSEAAIEPLTRAAATDPSARVRESAAKALHSIHAERP